MSRSRPIPVRIADLRNIGPATERWLREVGIETETDLRRIGAEEAWRRLRFVFGRQVTLNGLYALEAALIGCEWRDLPPETKDRLRAVAAEYRRGGAR